MLDLKIIGAIAIKKNFQDMQTRAKNPKTVMGIIGAKAYKDVINSFRIEENDDGSKWYKFKDPKTEKRISRRPTKRGGTKLLQDTGLLRESIRWESTALWAKVFTRRKYAKWHENGTRNIPARSFMWVNDRLRLKFAKDLLEYITNGH